MADEDSTIIEKSRASSTWPDRIVVTLSIIPAARGEVSIAVSVWSRAGPVVGLCLVKCPVEPPQHPSFQYSKNRLQGPLSERYAA